MEAWMGFVSIIAIVAIVVVAGGLIAFIGHVIIGAFDTDNVALKNKKEVTDEMLEIIKLITETLRELKGDFNE